MIQTNKIPRLAVVTSHPIQYNAPLFRELSQRLDLHVFFMHRVTPQDQARAGFGIGFQWDVDLLSGYSSSFLDNVAKQPGLHHFRGIDVPSIRSALKHGQFDAVLMTGWQFKCYTQAIWAAKRLGIPVMVRGDSHLGTPRGALKLTAKRLIYPLFLRLFDSALVVGKRNREYWEHYGYPRARMFDAHHSIDDTFFAERATHLAGAALRARLGIKMESKVVLFAGKLVPFKRPLDVVEAVAIVRNQGLDVHLIVAGSGQLSEALVERAAKLRTPIHMLDFCNQTEIPAAYAAANLLVLPSDGRETWGLVVNEALACGTPVLISDAIGCAPDIAEFFGSRSVFKIGDVSDLAEKLQGILNEPPLMSSLSDAVKHFNISNTADQIAKVTNLLISKSRDISL